MRPFFLGRPWCLLQVPLARARASDTHACLDTTELVAYQAALGVAIFVAPQGNDGGHPKRAISEAWVLLQDCHRHKPPASIWVQHGANLSHAAKHGPAQDVIHRLVQANTHNVDV